MTVQKTTGNKVTPFKSQSFFNDFNWSAFTPGDLVHLQDYHAADCAKMVGIFQGTNEQGPVIRLLPRPYEIILIRVEVENVSEMAATGFWSRFISN